MAQYGIKITGSIKIKKSTTANGFTYFQTLLAMNDDYKTKEKLYLNSMVNFKDREMKDVLDDGDIIEIIGSINLAKAQYKDKDLNINLFIEKVISINGNNNTQNNDEIENQQHEIDITDVDDLPF